ncbi:41291_t:CDS:2 [Gigaspora margarita]|uniref:41291_t:CDS:1 n=1 Tax=Gigaspora margarita TaxID=4874 RepID=A0ABN7UGT6_GIGMA|nr:41291_t:CDS:2 [Gigaspora margarita]
MVDQVHSLDKERLREKIVVLPNELLEKAMINFKKLTRGVGKSTLARAVAVETTKQKIKTLLGLRPATSN